MAYRTFNQFSLVLAVTFLAKGVGGILEGVDLIGHAGLAVVAGFAFFNFLPVMVGDSLAIRTFAVVAGFAFKSGLVRPVGKGRGFWGFGRVYS